MNAEERRDVVTALRCDYAVALASLHTAGVRIMMFPNEPSSFHAQRVLVALARRRLVSADSSRAESARIEEARELTRLRDIARRNAKVLRGNSREARLERRRFEALAREWDERANEVLRGASN